VIAQELDRKGGEELLTSCIGEAEISLVGQVDAHGRLASGDCLVGCWCAFMPAPMCMNAASAGEVDSCDQESVSGANFPMAHGGVRGGEARPACFMSAATSA
jgi:hypothetical protein